MLLRVVGRLPEAGLIREPGRVGIGPGERRLSPKGVELGFEPDPSCSGRSGRCHRDTGAGPIYPAWNYRLAGPTPRLPIAMSMRSSARPTTSPPLPSAEPSRGG